MVGQTPPGREAVMRKVSDCRDPGRGPYRPAYLGAAPKYALGAVPRVRRNMAVNALGVA